MEFKGKNILIIGFGRSGIASARFALDRGANVIIADKCKQSDFSKEIESFNGYPIEFLFGSNDLPAKKIDFIVVSPGVPLNIQILKHAGQKNIPVYGEMELAIQEIKTPMIAVSGTNGKTTTTSLIGYIFSACGKKVCVGGNIGTPLTSLVNEANDSEWVVVEVSSYQLETTPSLSPKIAVLLNVTPDHLDRHASFDEYLDTKMKLLYMASESGCGIYNQEDENITTKIRNLKGKYIPFNVHKDIKENKFYTRDLNGSVKSWDIGETKLKGSYNYENILASLVVANICGLDEKKVCEAVRNFNGLSHRVEFICEIDGVKYYDDSKGTNIGATRAALTNFEKGVILIAGGQDKGTGYKSLASLISSCVKKMILIGEARDRIKDEIGDFTETVFANDMNDAVRIAHKEAVKGDVVLLSPACASFDMFKNYAERGDTFKSAVHRLIER